MLFVKYITSSLIALLLLSGCTGISKFIDNFDSVPEMTSPCVGVEGSPCGPKYYPEGNKILLHKNYNFPA